MSRDHLSGCPSCGIIDLPIQQGPNLFICSGCASLYSVIPMTIAGKDILRVYSYERIERGDFTRKGEPIDAYSQA